MNFKRLRSVWFSDESRFLLERRDGRIRVYRRRRERFDDASLPQVDRFYQSSVIMWGKITSRATSDLVVWRSRVTVLGEEIACQLHAIVTKSEYKICCTTFHRNYTFHVVTHCQSNTGLPRQHGIQIVQWPALCPDICPIERL